MRYILLAIYILTILGIVFFERKRPTEALFWVVVVTLIPYVGVVLYLVFGDTLAIKITSYSRKKRLSKCMNVVNKESSIDTRDIVVSNEDLEVIKFNETYNNSKVTSYETSKLYTNGKDHYHQLFMDIDNAKECIYIEFYTIHNDVVGHSLVEHLTKKAQEGVKVLLMCDFIANLSTPPKMFKPLKKAGGQVIRIKPFFTHYRSHRKIVVIDHNISYIGGMNIGKKYINMGKKKNPWRDTQVRLTGSCSNILDTYFLTDWLCSVKRRKLNETVKYVNELNHATNIVNKNICQFICGGVETNKEAIKMCYLSMIRSAKKSILIQTPYFIPDTSVLDSLKTAIASGVKVTLLIPGIKSSFFLDPVTTSYIGELLEFGANVYKYNGYIHAKTMVIDDELCCIGSVNMDIRSFKIDDEVCGVFYNNELARHYIDIYKNDIQNSVSYSYHDFLKRGTKEKILESIFNLFAPLM